MNNQIKTQTMFAFIHLDANVDLPEKEIEWNRRFKLMIGFSIPFFLPDAGQRPLPQKITSAFRRTQFNLEQSNQAWENIHMKSIPYSIHAYNSNTSERKFLINSLLWIMN